MTESIAEIRDAIKRRWADAPVANVSLRLLDLAVEHCHDQNSRFTIRDMARTADIDPQSELLLQAISILSSRYPVFIWRLVFFDPNGHPHDLSRTEAADFVKTGHVIIDGEIVKDAGDSVYPFFEANASFICDHD